MGSYFLAASILYPASNMADIDPLLLECWSNVYDADLTLKQPWVKAPCFLGLAQPKQKMCQLVCYTRTGECKNRTTHVGGGDIA